MFVESSLLFHKRREFDSTCYGVVYEVALTIGGSAPRDNAMFAPSSRAEQRDGGGPGSLPVIAYTDVMGSFATREEAEDALEQSLRRSSMGLDERCWYNAYGSENEKVQVTLQALAPEASLIPVVFFGVVTVAFAAVTITCCLSDLADRNQSACASTGCCAQMCQCIATRLCCRLCGDGRRCCGAPGQHGHQRRRCGSSFCCRLGCVQGTLVLTTPFTRHCCYRLGGAVCCIAPSRRHILSEGPHRSPHEPEPIGCCSHRHRLRMGCSDQLDSGNCAITSRCDACANLAEIALTGARAPCGFGHCCHGRCHTGSDLALRCLCCGLCHPGVGRTVAWRLQERRLQQRQRVNAEMRDVDPWMEDPAAREALQTAIELSRRDISPYNPALLAGQSPSSGAARASRGAGPMPSRQAGSSASVSDAMATASLLARLRHGGAVAHEQRSVVRRAALHSVTGSAPSSPASRASLDASGQGHRNPLFIRHVGSDEEEDWRQYPPPPPSTPPPPSVVGPSAQEPILQRLEIPPIRAPAISSTPGPCPAGGALVALPFSQDALPAEP